MQKDRMRALVISLSDLTRDARVRRQIVVLSERFDVTTLSLTPANDLTIDAVTIRNRSLSLGQKIKRHLWFNLVRRQYDRWYWLGLDASGAIQALGSRHFDLVVANDIDSLPLARAIAALPSSIIVDAHEFSPRQFEHSWKWRLLNRPVYDWICRSLTEGLAGMLTVSRGIADEYERVYGVAAEVMRSAPTFASLRPSPTSEDTIRLVHHGGATPPRRIELMIEAMDYVDSRFTLTLILVPTGHDDYLRRLESMAEQRENVRVLPPVPPDELVAFSNQFDVGLTFFPPTTFNLRHVLPNKFFEYIQSRLAVLTGPSPEIQALVEQYGLGRIAASFSAKDLAAEINRLDTKSVQEYKRAADTAAGELCLQQEAKVLLRMADRASVPVKN